MKNRTVYLTSIGTGAIVLTAAVCVVGGFLGGAVSATDMPARPPSLAVPTGPALLTTSAGPIDLELTVDGSRVVTQVHDDGQLQTVGGGRVHAGLGADRVRRRVRSPAARPPTRTTPTGCSSDRPVST